MGSGKEGWVHGSALIVALASGSHKKHIVFTGRHVFVYRRQANPLKEKNLFNKDLEDNSGKRKASSSNPFMRRPKAKH